jgi:hypothetical protein
MGADELTLDQKIEQKTEKMKADIKETAIKAAAAQMALQIGLMFIPVIGWAIGAVVALAQFIIGKHYERKLKSYIEDGTNDITVFAKQANAQVTQTASRIYDEEYPAAVQWAVSGASINGLGEGFWSKLEDKYLKPAARTVRKINMIPTNLVVKASKIVVGHHMQASIDATKAVGLKSTSEDIQHYYDKGRVIADDIERRAADPKLASDLMSGKETADVAKARMDEIKNVVYASINKQTKEAIQKLESPQGRLEIRKQTALTLRDDPSVKELRTQFEKGAQQNAAQANRDVARMNSALTGSSLNKTTALVGTALAAGAAFLFMR